MSGTIDNGMRGCKNVIKYYRTSLVEYSFMCQGRLYEERQR